MRQSKPKSNPKPFRTGYWHGQDATILCGRSSAPEAILVGGYTDKEARKVRKIVLKDLPLGKYDESVVYPDPDEWKEQNS